MSRRRSLSTTISTDRAVHQLAIRHGDFAALLYTWMIPHAEDDATISGDPFEIMVTVVPTRRDKGEQDIADAIEGMIACGLLARREDGRLEFPPESFYKHQSYIPTAKRRTAESAPVPEPHVDATATNGDEQRESPQITDEQRATPTIAANRRRTAKNPASPSPSPSPTNAANAALRGGERENNPTWQLLAAICDVVGLDPRDYGGDLDKQLAAAKRILGKHGHDAGVACARWLLSDDWQRDRGIDAMKVADHMTRWISAGRPDALPTAPPPKADTWTPPYLRPFPTEDIA